MTRDEAIELFEKILAGAKQGLEEHPEEGKRVYGMRKELAEIALSALRPVSREQVERMRGEWIHDGPNFEGGTDWYHCSKCGAKETGVYVKHNFCSHCGAPMTDEAVQMVMERLEALKDGNDI